MFISLKEGEYLWYLWVVTWVSHLILPRTGFFWLFLLTQVQQCSGHWTPRLVLPPPSPHPFKLVVDCCSTADQEFLHEDCLSVERSWLSEWWSEPNQFIQKCVTKLGESTQSGACLQSKTRRVKCLKSNLKAANINFYIWSILSHQLFKCPLHTYTKFKCRLKELNWFKC